jgi:integrase
MSGCIIKRGERWMVIISIPDPTTGKRKRKYHSGYLTKKEAESACRRLVTSVEDQTYVEPSRQTVRQYFEAWLQDWAPLKAGPKTLERYQSLARHITSAIGPKPMQQVRGSDLAQVYREMAAKGLAPKTIKHVHVLARGVFRRALKLGDVKVDPMTQIDAPAVPSKEAAVLRVEEIPVMLAAVKGTSSYPIAVLALGTGMRRGELCALRWQDVDLDGGKLEVKRSAEKVRGKAMRYKEPKSAKGRRVISLSPSVVACLQEHRKAQLVMRLKLGLGKLPSDALVFTTYHGRPRLPDDVSKRFADAMTAAGLPHVSLHTLRHTHASMLIKAGEDILTISRRLGHSSAAITLNVYGHLMSSRDRAADIVESMLGGRHEPTGVSVG